MSTQSHYFQRELEFLPEDYDNEPFLPIRVRVDGWYYPETFSNFDPKRGLGTSGTNAEVILSYRLHHACGVFVGLHWHPEVSKFLNSLDLESKFLAEFLDTPGSII